jgi:N-acetylmuramoyl-L-alanine amidase
MKKLLIDSMSSAMSLITLIAVVVFAPSAWAENSVIANEEEVTYDESIRGFNAEQFPQTYCMALNIYYETRGSNVADSYAVADVVLNRVEDTRFPDTICDVVQDGYVPGKRNCQFSWYCDGKADDPQEEEAWARSQSIAWHIVKLDRYRGITEGATNYHAHYVNPSWTRSTRHFSIDRIGRIGDHIFYRWN